MMDARLMSTVSNETPGKIMAPIVRSLEVTAGRRRSLEVIGGHCGSRRKMGIEADYGAWMRASSGGVGGDLTVIYVGRRACQSALFIK